MDLQILYVLCHDSSKLWSNCASLPQKSGSWSLGNKVVLQWSSRVDSHNFSFDILSYSDAIEFWKIDHLRWSQPLSCSLCRTVPAPSSTLRPEVRVRASSVSCVSGLALQNLLPEKPPPTVRPLSIRQTSKVGLSWNSDPLTLWDLCLPGLCLLEDPACSRLHWQWSLEKLKKGRAQR